MSAADVKARFPEFASVPDALVDAVYAESARQVGSNWREEHRDDGRLYLTAHFLALEGRGTSSGSASGGPITEITVGDVTEKYASAQSSGDVFGFKSTAYGQRFLNLRRRNVVSVAAV